MIRKGFARRFALALMLGAAAGAQAKDDKADFAACDGRMKPKKSDDGMRGTALEKDYPRFFGSKVENPALKVAACTDALADPRLLPTQGLRKAHLLRARAAAYLSLGKPGAALADLDAAKLATADRAGDAFFDRSMGVSLAMLRAIGQAQAGELAAAAATAEAAAALRPYSLEVQVAATAIRQAARPVGIASESPWDALLQLDPTARTAAIASEAKVGDFAAVRRLGAAGPIDWGDAQPGIIVDRNGQTGTFTAALAASLDLAYAHAQAGDTAAARAELERVRTRLVPLEAKTMPARTPAALTDAAPVPDAPAKPGTTSLAEALAGSRIRLVEGRIALAEGRTADAEAAVAGGKVAFTAATLEFLAALAQATGKPVKDADGLAARLADAKPMRLGALADSLMIAPEDARKVIDYQKSRPNILSALIGGALTMGTSLLGGIERTAGFRSAANADGTTTVEYVGSTTSGPMVQEMTLLRAAELAKAAGKPRFAIVGRKDFSRYMTTSRGGWEMHRVLTGYKTELVVRWLDAGEAHASALDAVAVIDRLGPLYYEG